MLRNLEKASSWGFGGVAFSFCFQSEGKATISGSGCVTGDFISYGFPALEKKKIGKLTGLD